MADTYPPVVQRPALLALADAIDSRSTALRRDECSDWAIHGSKGKIFAVPIGRSEGFQLIVYDDATSSRQWGFTKKFLSFAKLQNDGDDGGSFILDRMPNGVEGEVIRQCLGIPKRRHLSDEERERLSRFAFKKYA